MENIKKVHFMGIGGAGVSAVAALAKAEGFEISGCDLDQTSNFLKPLIKYGLAFDTKHDPHHLENVDILVISPAIESLDPNNAEVALAKEKEMPVFTGEEFLTNYIIKDKKVIAISGTHGKSTTTALVAKILEEAGLDPSVLVGAIVLDWQANFRIGKGEYFVLEADEYQKKFLLYHPWLGVITAVEMDHPEFFQDLNEVRDAFIKFASQVQETLLLGKNIDLNFEGDVEKLGVDFPEIKFDLKLLGEFNQENANLAFKVGEILGIDPEISKKALEKFSGLSRRFEFRGEEKGVKVFDDYGHHPSAIKATIEAAKEKFPTARLWLVYQPHMYSRTAYLMDQFIEVFRQIPADTILLVDIYAARQQNKENISSSDLVEKVKASNVKYIGNFEDTAYYIAKGAAVNDVIVVMGAGDVYKLSDLILQKLKNRA